MTLLAALLLLTKMNKPLVAATLTPQQRSLVMRTHTLLAPKLAPTAVAKLKLVSQSLVNGPLVPDVAAVARRGIISSFPGAQFTDQQINTLSVVVISDAIDSLKSQLDSMSEIGETESLRLQMAEDRMSKFMSTLSNVLKKISDSSQGITQNLK